MAKYALVRESDNIVTNVVEWDGVERHIEIINDQAVVVGWLKPDNHIAVESDTATIGQTYDPINNTFSN